MRREHRRDMKELCGRSLANFEEIAARRTWHREVAKAQVEQAARNSERQLAEYQKERTASEFWPFEKPRKGKPAFDAKTYGAQLLVQAAERRKGATAPVRSTLPKPSTTKDTRVEGSLDEPSADQGARVPDTTKIATTATDTKIESLQLRHEKDWSKAQRSASQQPESYFSLSMLPFEEAERRRAAAVGSNKRALLEVLAQQVCEKQARELREHVNIYGGSVNATTKQSEQSTAAAEISELEERTRRAALRRADLEAQIAQKQHERQLLRAQSRSEQRSLDNAAALEEALTLKHKQLKKREQQAAIKLGLTLQQADSSRRVRRARFVD